MKELNIGSTIASKRREAGITQDELAAYIGVSKASVSKWETGQSYPDITFLPQIAAFFDISVDELLGYRPQMDNEEIKKLYLRLMGDFAEKPFEEVIAECRMVSKKYFSCYPLLYQLAVLELNHYYLAGDGDSRKAVLNDVISLCARVRIESEDIWLVKEAAYLEAAACLALEEPEPVLELFGEDIRPLVSEGELIAQAYLLLGDKSRARETMQICIYQYLLLLTNALGAYMTLNNDSEKTTDEVLKKAAMLSEAFELKKLHPNTIAKIYYVSAQAYCVNGSVEKALDMLQEYAEICSKELTTFILHGDGFFSDIGRWLGELNMGISAPRSEKLIRESAVQSIVQNPTFEVLSGCARFKLIVDKLSQTGGA